MYEIDTLCSLVCDYLQVLKPNLAFETVRYIEKDNLWIGPKQVREGDFVDRTKKDNVHVTLLSSYRTWNHESFSFTYPVKLFESRCCAIHNVYLATNS